MYCPACHRLDDPEALFGLIEAHALGSWICLGADGWVAHHSRFQLDRASGPHGTLRARIDPAEADAQGLPDGSPVLVVFRGPQTYITPGWYPGKTEHGRVVPTWNYQVVQVHGTLRWSADPTGLEIPILRLDGKLKASQDEALPDRAGTVRGLHAVGSDTACAMARLVQQALDTPHP